MLDYLFEKKHLIAVLFVLCMALVLISMFTTPAYAALTDTNIGATISGSTDDSSISGNAIMAKVKTSLLATTNKNYTISLTNNSGAEATMSFVYNVSHSGRNSYSMSVMFYAAGSSTGTSVSLASGATFERTMPAGSRVEITADVGNGCTVTTNLTDISLKIKTTADVTFTPDYAVSYTVGYVDGDAAAQTATVTAGGSDVTVEAELSEGFTITPTTSGYSCESAVGTTSGTVFIDGNNEFTFQKNETVTPSFLSSSGEMPFTHLGVNKSYFNLGAAVNAGSGTVVLNQEYTLPAGNYTIPYGVTLLIPYDDANTLITNNMKDHVNTSYDNPPAKTLYRQLTMASGASITVNGAISVGSQALNQMIGQVGPYGAIVMDEGSSITIESGGNLYAYGYIFYGEGNGGTVTVKNGGTVYEDLITPDYDYAGGVSNVYDEDAFPLRSYTIRNVEVPMTFHYGAKEYAFFCTYSGTFNATYGDYILFIGSDASSPFQLESGTTLVKSYSSGRQYFTINGNATLNSISLKIQTSLLTTTMASSNTSGFVLPSEYEVTIASGTLTLNDNVVVAEGAKFTIAKGAIVNTNGKNVYILDADDDPGSVKTIDAYSRNTADVHGTYYTHVNTDAVLDVNGTLNVSGGFYTSNGGASITSSGGTGVINITAASTDTSINIKTIDFANALNSTYFTCSFNPAKLKNANPSTPYTETATGGVGTYYYCLRCGMWKTDNTHSHSDGYKTNVSLTDSLYMHFAFPVGTDVDWQSYTATVTHVYADGTAKEETCVLSETTMNNIRYCKLVYKGVAAKDMADAVYVTVKNGDTVIAFWGDSIRAYGMRLLTTYPDNVTLRKAVVDMLNYGAACQTYFGYNTGSLANSLLSNEQTSYASTQTYKPTEGTSPVSPDSNGNTCWRATQLVADSNIWLRIAFDEGVTAGMQYSYSFSGHKGNEVTHDTKYDINEADFVTINGTNYFYGIINKLVTADAAFKPLDENGNETDFVITVTVYKADGSQYGTFTESPLNYVSRFASESGNDVYTMLMRFSESALAYLHGDEVLK